MVIKKVEFNEFTDKLASVIAFRNSIECRENKDVKKKMLKLIEKVANGELTKRQKECLFMYYEKGMRMCEISDNLGICVSCVSRHIKKAKSKICKMLTYYYSIK